MFNPFYFSIRNQKDNIRVLKCIIKFNNNKKKNIIILKQKLQIIDS